MISMRVGAADEVANQLASDVQLGGRPLKANRILPSQGQSSCFVNLLLTNS